MRLSVSVYSNDNGWLNDLYGREPKENEAIQFTQHDIGIHYFNTQERGKGFGLTETIVDLALNIGVGVPAGIIANMIYDKIMNKGKNKLVIVEEELTILTKDELISYVKKHTEKEV